MLGTSLRHSPCQSFTPAFCAAALRSSRGHPSHIRRTSARVARPSDARQASNLSSVICCSIRSSSVVGPSAGSSPLGSEGSCRLCGGSPGASLPLSGCGGCCCVGLGVAGSLRIHGGSHGASLPLSAGWRCSCAGCLAVACPSCASFPVFSLPPVLWVGIPVGVGAMFGWALGVPCLAAALVVAVGVGRSCVEWPASWGRSLFLVPASGIGIGRLELGAEGLLSALPLHSGSMVTVPWAPLEASLPFWHSGLEPFPAGFGTGLELHGPLLLWPASPARTLSGIGAAALGSLVSWALEASLGLVELEEGPEANAGDPAAIAGPSPLSWSTCIGSPGDGVLILSPSGHAVASLDDWLPGRDQNALRHARLDISVGSHSCHCSQVRGKRDGSVVSGWPVEASASTLASVGGLLCMVAPGACGVW